MMRCVLGRGMGWVMAVALWCGCMPEFDATFQPGATPQVFGTLFDDRGNFEFVRDAGSGELIRAEADAGTITLPATGQDFGVTRNDGSSLSLQPSGADDVLIVVRGDGVFDDVDLTVSRTALGDLANVVRQPAGAGDAFCETNQDFLDGACDLTNGLNLPGIVTTVQAELAAQDPAAPSVAEVSALFGRYLSLVSDCCLGWAEYRDNGGDPCP